MEMSDISAFVTVARYRSFSRAAEALFLTQPAVSKRVSALELELDTQLFNRINRKVSLTESGKELLPLAQELLNQAEDIRRQASSLNREASGVLTMATSHHVGLHRLPPILREFNRRFADVTLDIQFGESETACDAVQRGDIELAVVTLPTSVPKELKTSTIWQDELCFMVANDHPLAQVKNVNVSDLLAYPAVLPSQNTATYDHLLAFLGEQASPNVQMTTNNLETLKMLVEVGIGWSLLPVTMLSEHVVALNTKQTLSRDLGIVIHAKRSLSHAARRLIELIDNSLKK